MKVNFNGVEPAKAIERVSKVIEPGVQELVITGLDTKTAQTGTAYVEITFNKKDNPVEYPLKERFFLTQKSLPRFMSFLEEVLGRSFEGVEIDTDVLAPELKGKINTYLVDGEEYLKPNTNGGEPFKNVRAKFAYSGFVNPPADSIPNIQKLPVTETPAPTAGPATEAEDDGLPF